jgi:hypothetical protein
MTAGTQSFMGKALPISGNATFTGETAATDILTITSATAQTGDSLVINGINSTTANGIKINVTSTGAMAASAAENCNAILVQASSKSVLNCVVFYDSEPSGATAASVSSAVAFLGSAGTKAPAYFLTMGGTGGPGEGAATTNGYFTAGLTSNTAATKAAFGGIKCLFGSKAYYILAVPDSNLT